MKNLLKLSLILLITAFFLGENATAQQRGGSNGLSPDAMVSQTIFNKTTITVTYGRPGLKGRELSTLAPAGKIWRTGANEASTITFSTDVNFGGQAVPAGTYTLFTIPGDNWTFILNKQLTRGEGDDRVAWGAFGYNQDQDLVRVPAAETVSNAPAKEHFAIYFDSITDTKTHLNLHWGSTKATVPITIE